MCLHASGCHCEARPAGRRICFAPGHNRFLASLGMTNIGLPRHTRGLFPTEPGPTQSHLMRAGRSGAPSGGLKVKMSLQGVAAKHPAKRVRPSRSQSGRGMAGSGGKIAGLRNEPNRAPSEAQHRFPAEFSWIGFTAGWQSWSRSRFPG